jgi:hypothetical protein
VCDSAAGSSCQDVNTGLNAALYAPQFFGQECNFYCDVKLASFSRLKVLIPHHMLQNDLVYFTWTKR